MKQLILITPELKHLMQSAFFALGRSQQIAKHQEDCEDCKIKIAEADFNREIIKTQVELLTKKSEKTIDNK